MTEAPKIPDPLGPVPPIDVIWSVPLWPYSWACAALALTREQLDYYRRIEGLPVAKIGKHPYILRDDLLLWFKTQAKSEGGERKR